MRNRDYKNSFSGGHYHIYNRGNEKRDIFLDNDDYRFFLLRLRQNLKPTGNEPSYFRPLLPDSFSLISYCLMPNHFHLQIRQNGEIPPGVLMGKICTSYSMYFNKKYERVGHVFQDQFKQVSIDTNRYFLWLASYIHQNPVKAGIAKLPEQYAWSSIAEYVGEADLCDTKCILEQFNDLSRGYLDYLHEGFLQDDELISEGFRLE